MIGDKVLKAATVIHSKKTTESSAKAEWGQSTSMQKPPVSIVYARRNKRSMEKQDSKSFLEKVHRKEMEARLVGDLEGAQMAQMNDSVARDYGGESKRLHEDDSAPPPTFRPLLNDGSPTRSHLFALSSGKKAFLPPVVGAAPPHGCCDGTPAARGLQGGAAAGDGEVLWLSSAGKIHQSGKGKLELFTLPTSGIEWPEIDPAGLLGVRKVYMAQQEHNMVTKCTEEEEVLAQATGSKSSENNAGQGQAFTFLSNKRKCFACKEASHSLDQCSIKGLVAGAQLFGHSTRQPFYMIQPSEEAVEKEKFYHRCLLITSDVSNLDPRKLTDWEIRTEGRHNLLVSLNSKDDLVSCLKTPRIETSIDDKEVNFTVARWKEDDDENIELIREWILVYGVPRIYRNWKELYQIASAVGVLIDVDEESLEGDHKEPIKLKVALRGVDGAPFSCHFVFGWHSRCVTFTIEDKVQTTDNVQTDELIEMPPEILNKGMNSESSSHDTSIVISTHNHTLDVKGCSDKELETIETAVLVEEPSSAEVNTSAPAPTTIISEKTAEDSPRAEREQSISGSSTSMIGDTLFKAAATVIHSKKTTEDIPKAEGGQSTSGNSTSIIGEEPFRGIQKPPVKIVYARRNKRSMEKQDYTSFLEKQHQKEMEAAIVGQRQKSDDESGGDGNNKDSNSIAPSAIAINSKKKQTTKDIVTTQGAQSISESSIGETQTKDLDKPSAVHQRGIVPLCNGMDIIQQSLFGTTVTLCCGILQRLDYASTECQALVLVPTRHLAHETKNVIGVLGQFLSAKAHAFCGGTSAHEDQQILSTGVQVAVGTPCHVLGMLQGRALCPDHIRMFVLDEADEVLRGFKDQIHGIIQFLPTKTQFGFFSASFSHEALEMCRKFMNKPVEIIVPRDEELEGINVKQFYVNVEKEDCKLDKLCGLFDTMEITRSIIFVNTRRKAKSLTEKIRGKGYTVSAIHGGIHQGIRDKAVQEFQSGSSRILITTDLRGINVLRAPAAIIYDLPTQPVCYLRHVQRSGQHGRKGVAISFITSTDERVFSTIQKFCNTQIEELPSNVADLI
uniref:RNA helicase n=1 Tax=Oryza meridionalis TaxID=40149 RepID=A0A0E0CI32_9ORYZ